MKEISFWRFTTMALALICLAWTILAISERWIPRQRAIDWCVSTIEKEYVLDAEDRELVEMTCKQHWEAFLNE